MSDDIAIVSPGGLLVDTERLLQRAADYLAVAGECRLALGQVALADVAGIRGLLGVAAAPAVAYRAEDLIDTARDELVAAVAIAEGLAVAVGAAALAYAAVERAVHTSIAGVAWTVGNLARLAIPQLIVTGGLLVGGWYVAGMITGADVRDDGLGAIGKNITRFLHDHPRLTSDPALAASIRLASEGLDEFGMGFAGVPPWVALTSGDEDLGWIDSRDSARVLAGLGLVGLFRETGVSVSRIATDRVPTETPSLDELVRRLPNSDETGATKVRVERYHHADGTDSFIVYVGGTTEWSPVGSDDPMDLTSNVVGLAGLDPASERAARLAMAQAGVTASTPVVFVGHSQGGLIAHELAASGDYTTVGVFEIGSPADQVSVDDDIPDIRLVHTGDPVPATGGESRTVDVVRDPWSDTDMPPEDTPVVAHDAGHYADTAALAQKSDDPRVKALRDAIASVTDGSTSATAERFSAKRERG